MPVMMIAPKYITDTKMLARQVKYYVKQLAHAERQLAKPLRATRANAYRGKVTIARRAIAELKARKAELAKGNDMNRAQKIASMESQSTLAPPNEGWHLITNRSFQSGGKTYPRGCEVEPAVLGANFQALLNGHYVEWKPPQVKAVSTPRDLPPPEPPKEKVFAAFIDVPDDPVRSWKRSLEETAKRCGGDFGRAKDILYSTDKGSKLYLLAVRVGSEADARKNNMPGRRVVPTF